MKKFLMMAALLLGTLSMSAQDYNWAIGVRGGGVNGGLTCKHNLDINAFEIAVDLGWDHDGRLQGLYEWQVPVIAKGFNFYYGVGAFVGAYNFSENAQVGIGAEGIVGLEHIMDAAPIAFSIDYRPSVGVIPEFRYGCSDIGLGIKFYF